MILALNTSTPTCKMWLMRGGQTFATQNWLAERRLAGELLSRLEAFLHRNKSDFTDLSGLIVFRGPGSFTGLRIGITVMNTLASALAIPIVGETGEKWRPGGEKKLRLGKNEKIILPEYGAPAHITKPKK